MTEPAPVPDTPAASEPPAVAPPRRDAWPWIVAAAAGWTITVVSVWVLRPTWGICIDGVGTDGTPFGGCSSGTDSTVALVTSVLALAVLAAVVIVAVLARGRARLPLLIALCAALVLVAIVGIVASLVVGATTPIPYGPFPYS
ncbi:MAG: hypothetical protein J0G30_09790 [Actinomycetales bacterium]|nr:hypothetical protein [Actinomycetales bacterium]